MKTLIDTTQVSSRSYYYLLDFNEKDEWKTIENLFEKRKLNELLGNEYGHLFQVATNREIFLKPKS